MFIIILGLNSSNIYQNLNNYYYQHFYQNSGYHKTQAMYPAKMQSPYYRNYLYNIYRYPNMYQGNYYKSHNKTSKLNRKRSRSNTSSSSSSSDSYSKAKSSSSSSS